MKNKHVNAIVVGAGAGGGIVAKELAVAGYSVVLFERGEWPDYDKHINDELLSQRNQILGSAYVNEHCQVHAIDNLFIADGSVLVTSGGFNPVLTIMAIAYKTGEYIVKNFDAIKARYK